MNFNKVAVCGSHSCGKTTLVNALKENSAFKFHPLIKEIAATYTPAERVDIFTQLKIMQKQAIAEKTYTQNYSKFLSDRTVIDNIAYSTLASKNIANRTDRGKNIYKLCYALSYAHLHMIPQPYDLLIFVDEILEFKSAPHRAYSDFKTQKFIYDFIKSEIKELSIPTVYVTGTTEQRIDTILEYMTVNKDM